MPRIKRWFPVSQDINADPEVWAMRHQIGEKSLSIWLEFLSIADRNQGELPGDSEELLRLVSGRCQAAVRTVRAVYQFALSRMWLTSDLPLKVTKWGKYHVSRGDKKNTTTSLPSEPSEPSEPIKKIHKNVSPPRHTETVWPAEDQWLCDLLKSQWFLANTNGQLFDYSLWEDVSKEINGVDRAFIEPEFAKMSAWLRENPNRRPTAKGCKRFVRTWLERARSQQRRFSVVK